MFLASLLYHINIVYAQDLLNYFTEMRNTFEKYFGLTDPFYITTSNSMKPVINIDDLIIASSKTKFEELMVGDIIVFNRPKGDDKVIVARIIEISDRFGEKVIVTKGDANDGIIPGTDFPIREKDYIGVAAVIIPPSFMAIESEQQNETNKVSVKINLSPPIDAPFDQSISIKLNNSETGQFASRAFSVPISGEASTTFDINDYSVPEGKSFSICIENFDSNKEDCKRVIRENGTNQINVDFRVP